MTDDDICGAECADGTPCEHPAGSCPVDSHDGGKADDAAAGGRPSKFTEDRTEDILEAARRGATVEGCARAAGIGESTLYEWLDRYPEFSEAFNRARAEGERELLEDVIEDDPKFILERSFGYTKTEKRELEHDTAEGAEFSFNVVFSDEVDDGDN